MAMKMLKAKLYEMELERREQQTRRTRHRRAQSISASQIRNYVLAPYRLVKDVRIEHRAIERRRRARWRPRRVHRSVLLAAAGGDLRKGGAVEDDA